jgi:membrane-bound lytic murein transglycosylase B
VNASETREAYSGREDIQDPRDAILARARFLDAAGARENTRAVLSANNCSDVYVGRS